MVFACFGVSRCFGETICYRDGFPFLYLRRFSHRGFFVNRFPISIFAGADAPVFFPFLQKQKMEKCYSVDLQHCLLRMGRAPLCLGDAGIHYTELAPCPNYGQIGTPQKSVAYSRHPAGRTVDRDLQICVLPFRESCPSDRK